MEKKHVSKARRGKSLFGQADRIFIFLQHVWTHIELEREAGKENGNEARALGNCGTCDF